MPVFVRLRTFTSLLLLALWLPVTQHCGLEVAGLIGTPVDCHAESSRPESHNESHCDTDHCELVENSAYKASLGALKMTGPVVLTCFCCRHEIIAETIVVPQISPARSTTPPELAPTWHFVTRAVAEARAPGSHV